MNAVWQVVLGDDGVILALVQSNTPQAGGVDVEEETFRAALPLVGRARLVAGAIVEIPAAPAPLLPLRVSAVQAKTALYDAGLYNDVEAAMQAFPYPLVRIWWASAQQWMEDHPYIYAVAEAKGLTDEQVHQLFVAASAVPT